MIGQLVLELLGNLEGPQLRGGKIPDEGGLRAGFTTGPFSQVSLILSQSPETGMRASPVSQMPASLSLLL